MNFHFYLCCIVVLLLKAVDELKIVKKTGRIMARHEHTIMITDGHQ
ncbi:MAG: hypothetical protein AB2L20_11260 [Mangrovibacterium sp.]